jgi:hypothetical protein
VAVITDIILDQWMRARTIIPISTYSRTLLYIILAEVSIHLLKRPVRPYLLHRHYETRFSSPTFLFIRTKYMMRVLCLFVSSWEYLFPKPLKAFHFTITGLERKLSEEINFGPLIMEYEMARACAAGLEFIRYV